MEGVKKIMDLSHFLGHCFGRFPLNANFVLVYFCGAYLAPKFFFMVKVMLFIFCTIMVAALVFNCSEPYIVYRLYRVYSCKTGLTSLVQQHKILSLLARELVVGQ